MSAFTKKILSIVLISFLIVHFSFVFINVIPITIKNLKFSILSKAYFSAFFQQNWNVFVPAPNYQHYLLVRYKKANVWTNWKDILGSSVEKNQHYKFRGNECVTLLLSTSLIYELNVLQKESTIFQKVPFNKEFTVLQFAINNYLMLNEDVKQDDDYEIIIISIEPNLIKTYYFKDLSVFN